MPGTADSMDLLGNDGVAAMLLAIGVLLAGARVLGELARRMRQTAVVGEILAGVLLGPTVLGALAPAWAAALFPAQGPGAVVLDGLATLAVTLFLLVAGMEVDLSSVRRQGAAALKVGTTSVVVPAGLGFAAAWLFPSAMGAQPDADHLAFALFIAIALAISALPVIAKTLIDLGIYRTDLGMLVVSAAALNDLVGWLVFALLLGLMDAEGASPRIALTVCATLAFAGAMLTVGRWVVDRALAWVQENTSWPAGVLTLTLALTLMCAAFTEWLGLHAIFGAFLVGVAIGDSPNLRQQTRTTIDHFVSSFFAPLFFASIGLRVDFVAHFDALLVLTIFGIACAGKLLGGLLGARWSGLQPRAAWIVAFALNARGAMEIVLGLLALRVGLVHPRLFVALVLMALATSIIGGPLIRSALRRPRHWIVTDLIVPKTFVRRLAARTRGEALSEVARVACAACGLAEGPLEAAVVEREEAAPTGIENGLALPHARIAGLRSPVVVAALSERGIDFDAPDGSLARVIFLILTPPRDGAAQLEIMSSVARSFRDPESVERALGARNLAAFLEIVREGAQRDARAMDGPTSLPETPR